MRTEAGGSLVVLGQEAGPRLGQAQEPQGMARGGRVEHNVVVAGLVAGEQAHELVEGGDLRGAGARELLARPCPAPARVAPLIWSITRPR